MAEDDFESLVKGQLEGLQGRLVKEHRLALEKLEERIAALTCERHLKQQRSQGEETSGRLPSGVWPPIGGLADAGAAAGGSPPPKALGPDAEPCRGGDKHGSWGSVCLPEPAGGGCWARPPPQPPEAFMQLPRGAAPASGRESRLDSSGSAARSFQVLELWNQVLLREQQVALSRQSIVSATSSFADFMEMDAGLTQRCYGLNLASLMLQPSSVRCLCWEIMRFVCIAYDLIIIPLLVFGPQEITFMIFLSWLIRLFWTVDIFINCITGHVTPQGRVELRLAKVVWRYFHTWFFFDLMLVGCDWVVAISAAVTGERGIRDAMGLRLLGMLRAVRLIRLARLVQKVSEFIFEHIRSEGAKLVAYIVSVILMLLCLVHVIACLWHGIHSDAEGFVPEAGAQSPVAQYFVAFHHVLALFAGEHVLEPGNLPERLFIIGVLIFAWVVSGAFVGSLTTAMTQLQLIASKRSTQFATLNRYLSDYGITRELTTRVQMNARHALQEQKRQVPESRVELMALISEHLRSEIHYEVCSPILVVHPFFRLYNSINPVGMRHISHSAVSQTSLSRGDVLFSEAVLAVVPKMFFIISGRLVYMRGVDIHRQHRVEAKQWAAEALLWTKWTHRGTLRALTECRVLALDATRLASIMSTFPTCHGSQYAARFVGNLNLVQNSKDLTDIPESVEQVRNMAIDVFTELDPRFKLPLEWTPGLTLRRRSSILSLLSSGSHIIQPDKVTHVTSVTSVVPSDAN